jgi:hypothetical protein
MAESRQNNESKNYRDKGGELNKTGFNPSIIL